jgi:hypothetical protein
VIELIIPLLSDIADIGVNAARDPMHAVTRLAKGHRCLHFLDTDSDESAVSAAPAGEVRLCPVLVPSNLEIKKLFPGCAHD